ncbi:hypothetical protein QZH41_016430, partial [Actinostola sp. cb2023]
MATPSSARVGRREEPMNASQTTEKPIQWYRCQEFGHKSSACVKKPQLGQVRQCYKCSGFGHEAKVCPSVRRPTQRFGRGNSGNQDVSGLSEWKGKGKNMPVVKGKIGETIVDTLRDTGCSGVVVKREFDKDEQLTGKFGYMMLIDNTVREVPVALITVDTPYFKGEVEAQCLPDSIYDLIIGNIPGARNPEKPDPDWCEDAAMTTRTQAKRSDVLAPLRVTENHWKAVDKEQLEVLQRQDKSLDKLREMNDVKAKGSQEVSLEEKEEVLSDRGSQFISDCMKEVARLLNINQLTTTPYHPMCNGLVEKFNGTLKTMLRRLSSEQPRQWHKYVDALLFAYREVPQESTGFSPFELLYGRTVRGPMHILRELWTKDVTKPDTKNCYQYVFELRDRMEQTLQIAQEQLKVSQERYKHYYDRRAKPSSFHAGDHVLVRIPTNNNKLLMQWKGPYTYTIESVVGLYDYKVRVKGKVKTYHANLLKLYIKRQPLIPESSLQVGIALYSSTDLPPTVELQLKNLVNQYAVVFTDLPRERNAKKDVDEMLELGVIRESDSPYASPVVIVQKKDGTNRVCIDYRKLNKITIFDPVPMVTVEELLSKLSQDMCFSKVDLSKGYWQIFVAAQDIPKTAFVT